MDATDARPIVLAGGGTAGSITALLAVAEEIRRLASARGCIFVGTADGPERALIEADGWPFQTLPAGKWRRYWSWENVRDVGRIFFGFVASLRLVSRLRPALIISAGGYVAVPLLWAAWLRRVPSLVHQQDRRPGLANRLVATCATRLTVALPPTAHEFQLSTKVRVTGNPVRSAVWRGSAQRARTRYGLPERLPLIVCLGGSTGAQGLNELFTSAIEPLLVHCSVIHITGVGRAGRTIVAANYRAFPFLTNALFDVLAAADVAITRAGMGVLSELSALGIAMIVVPMPRSHQEANAQYVADVGAGVLVPQSAGPAALRDAMESLLNDPVRRQRLGQAAHNLLPAGAAERVAQEALSLIRR